VTNNEDAAFQAWVADKSFFVVEDVTSSRLLVAALLRSLGAKKVVSAVEGNEALEKIATTKVVPDIMICDWVMPGMDGITLLAEVKKNYPATKFIMLTARTEVDDIKLARTTGVDGYVGKPFSRESLVNTLRKLMPAA
jgi:two-component system chemotaxis response regulator CheY